MCWLNKDSKVKTMLNNTIVPEKKVVGFVGTKNRKGV
jgi:hypothetical protein